MSAVRTASLLSHEQAYALRSFRDVIQRLDAALRYGVISQDEHNLEADLCFIEVRGALQSAKEAFR